MSFEERMNPIKSNSSLWKSVKYRSRSRWTALGIARASRTVDSALSKKLRIIESNGPLLCTYLIYKHAMSEHLRRTLYLI